MQINASMLHELRMVMLHAGKLFKRTRGLHPQNVTLLCVTCIRLHPVSATPAVTVNRGNAVCLAHFYS